MSKTGYFTTLNFRDNPLVYTDKNGATVDQRRFPSDEDRKYRKKVTTRKISCPKCKFGMTVGQLVNFKSCSNSKQYARIGECPLCGQKIKVFINNKDSQ